MDTCNVTTDMVSQAAPSFVYVFKKTKLNTLLLFLWTFFFCLLNIWIYILWMVLRSKGEVNGVKSRTVGVMRPLNTPTHTCSILPHPTPPPPPLRNARDWPLWKSILLSVQRPLWACNTSLGPGRASLWPTLWGLVVVGAPKLQSGLWTLHPGTNWSSVQALICVQGGVGQQLLQNCFKCFLPDGTLITK